MSESTRSLEIRVGFFVSIGLAVIAAMAIQFGRLGQGLRHYYSLTVELPNAGGILKGSDVLLAGARIGHVATKPVIAANIHTVQVKLNVLDHIKLPKGARFQVGSSGLLGDRFIDVNLPEGFDPSKFNPEDPNQVLQPGAVVEGTPSGGGINELAEKGGEVVEDLKVSLARIQELTARIQTGVLSEENLENLQVTFANLKTTSERFAEASGKLDDASGKVSGVLDDARVVVKKASDTMGTVDSAAEDLRGAIADARKVLASAQSAVTEAQTGEGVIANLLTNQKLADDLSALVSNLRRHGVLFYRDSSPRDSSSAEAGEVIERERLPAPVRPPNR